jgi:uridylate kinase
VNPTKVISLGGSLIAPDRVDVLLLGSLRRALVAHLEQDPERRLILVCGGGATAREYQRAFGELLDQAGEGPAGKGRDELADWIGIAATRLNAELVKHLFHSYCPERVVTDPSAVSVFPGRVLVAAGWKPGFSTDYDAVLLAERFQADTLINLSNVARVYSADPKSDPDAKPFDRLSWAELQKLVGQTWKPGINLPFDPVASERAAQAHLRVIVASGRDVENVTRILEEQEFEGTVIGPD